MNSKIYCSNCGTLTNANANFCQACGAPLHGPDAAVYHAQAPAVAPGVIPPKTHTTDIANEYYPRQNLGSGALLYFFLNFIGKSVVVLGALTIGAFLMPKLFALLVVAYFVLIFIAAFLEYNNFTFEITEDGLFIYNGVIQRAEVSVPFGEIENVNIERTLMDRLLGLSKVSLETAGSALGNVTNGEFTNKSRAEAVLPGLDHERARHIHDLIIDATDGVIDSTPPFKSKK